MEYRDFRYSNELGVVELEPGSRIGVALSRLIIKTIQIVMIVVFVGLAHCGVKYLTWDADPPKTLTPFSPAAVAAASTPALDYRQHPPPRGATASPAAITGTLVSVAPRDPHVKLFERLVRHPVYAKARLH